MGNAYEENAYGALNEKVGYKITFWRWLQLG